MSNTDQNNSALLQFEAYPNFLLVPLGWGEASPSDIIKVLESVISEFYSLLDPTQIPEINAIVRNSIFKTPINDGYPEIRKNHNYNDIYLACENRYWSQYAYQFSHELCHHVVNTNFLQKNDKFGWIEEVLCELTSITVLLKMAVTWCINSPYESWASYSESLLSYVTEILETKGNFIEEPFTKWLSFNLELLQLDRYKRVENRIIAINLLPVFSKHPLLWHTIHYLKAISINDDMDFKDYLHAWKTTLPENIVEVFSAIENVFKETR